MEVVTYLTRNMPLSLKKRVRRYAAKHDITMEAAVNHLILTALALEGK